MPEDEGAGGATPADEGGLSARERRARRVRAEQRAGMPKRLLLWGAVGLAAVLVIGGIVLAVKLGPQGPRYGHEHSGFKMFVDGEEISFLHPAFDLSTTGYVRGHVHNSDGAQHVLHMEQELGVTLGRFFESLDVRMSPDKVVLDQAVHAGRTVANNETHSWQLWVSHCKDPADTWTLEPKFQRYAPVHHDRMLIAYTWRNATRADLQPSFDLVPTDAQIASVGKDTC